MLSRFVRVRSVVAPLGSAVLTMSVLGLVLVGVGQTGERPTLVRPDDTSVLETNGDDVVRDPTGLTDGATDLVAPTLLEAVTGEAGAPRTEEAESTRQESLADSAVAATDSAETATEETTGTSAIAPDPTNPPLTLAFDEGDLARTPTYPDPWSSIVAAMGRGLEPSSGATTRGVDADVIAVAGVVAQTNVGGGLLVGVCEGAAARFARANETAELSRRIETLECADDETDPVANAREVAALVERDAFAVVPLVSPAFVDATQLREDHVPHVGWGGQAAFCGRNTGYGINVSGATDCPLLDARGYTALTTPVLTALSAALGPEALTATTLVTEDSPRGEQRSAALGLESALLGIAVTSLEVLPPASAASPTSWTSIAREILGTEPTMVVLDAAMIDGLPEALRAAGYDGEIAWVGTVDPLDLLAPDATAEADAAPVAPGAEPLPTPTVDPASTDPAAVPATPTAEAAPEPVFVPSVADGLVVVSAGVNLAATGSAAWARILSDATRVEVAADDIGLGFVQGYLSADLFVSSLAATPEPLTAESWYATVNSGWWYGGLGEVACGGWWPAGHIVDHPCVSVARVDHASASLIPLLGLRETTPQFEFRLEG